MEIKIIKESMKEEWEEYIMKNPYSIAWQSYEWSDVLRRHYSFRFYPVAAFKDSDICGILPLYHMKTLSLKDILISVPYAVAGGIVADSGEIKQALLEKAIEISHNHNSCRIVLKQYKLGIEGNVRTDDNYYNRELGLSVNIDAIWDEISDGNKESIEESESYDLEIEYPFNDINAFYKILLSHSHSMGVPCVAEKWISSLVDAKMYSIAVMKRDGEILAATMIKSFKKTISFPFTCLADIHSRENELFAINLYWNLIKQFARNGYEIFHSGRIPRTDITNSYRLGWGGTKYNYYYQYYPDNMVKTEYSTKRGRKREIFQSCWKLMPRSIVKLLGPHIVRQFP